MTGRSSLPVAGAMQPLALLCALCCGLLAVAASAGYSEDSRSWRGSYDPREQPLGAAFSPRRGLRDGVVRSLGWESLRPGTKSLVSLRSAKDAAPQFPPPTLCSCILDFQTQLAGQASESWDMLSPLSTCDIVTSSSV